MSPREFALLRILMENADKLVSKTRLQETLYGWTRMSRATPWKFTFITAQKLDAG